MKRGLLVLTLATALGVTGAAHAGLEGRLSTYDVTSAYGGIAKSTENVLLLRTWLLAEELNGKKMDFHLDARSELGLFSPNDTGLFNTNCDGTTDPTCAERTRRHAVLGDLDRIAGIYDAYLDFGGGPGHMGFILGRRTVYEAGALTVDGIDVRREGDSGRIGGFAGIAPNPLTGIPDPDYAAAGAYYSQFGRGAIIRVAGAAKFFEFKPDVIYIYTQDFFRLGKSLSASTIAQVDFVPFVADRLVILDLTYRSGPRSRFRVSFHRYRSEAFENNPIFREVFTLPTPYDPNPTLETPESKSFTESTTYHQARLIGQLEVAPEITAFAKAGFRQRTIDGSSGPVFEIGASTYSRIKYPVQGLVRYQYDGAFDSNDHTISLNVWRKLTFTGPTTVGGGFTYIMSKATQLDETQNPDVSAKYSIFSVNGFLRYDIAKYAFFAEYELSKPSAIQQGQPQSGTEDLDAPGLEHLLILGFTMRFGQGAKRLF